MVRNIHDLPAELVRLVLQKDKTESRVNRDASFTNTPMTCRRWHQLGEELLCTEISLTNSQLREFQDASTTALSFTRSLSIRITTSSYDSIYEGWHMDESRDWSEIRKAHLMVLEDLRYLGSLLGTMVHLESFSLVASVSGHHYILPGFHFPGRDIQLLLDQLPLTPRNLELDDTVGRWDPFGEGIWKTKIIRAYH